MALQVLVKPQGAKEAPMDLLIMENIFYEGHLAPIYDLKGSERARLAREDPQDPACVLLDQNLANSNVHSPLLVKATTTAARLCPVQLVSAGAFQCILQRDISKGYASQCVAEHAVVSMVHIGASSADAINT